jgi:hypothetical protein
VRECSQAEHAENGQAHRYSQQQRIQVGDFVSCASFVGGQASARTATQNKKHETKKKPKKHASDEKGLIKFNELNITMNELCQTMSAK